MEKISDYENLRLEPTVYDQEQARNAAIIADNDRRERYHLIKRVKKIPGFKEPKPGDTLYVMMANRQATRRNRAGLRFEGAQGRRPIRVVELTDDQVQEKQRAGADVVNVWGALKLWEDDALVVFHEAASVREAAELESQLSAAQEESANLRKELTSLRAAKRDARQKATDSPTGAPSRLQAAGAVKGSEAAEEALAKDTEIAQFGADPSRE